MSQESRLSRELAAHELPADVGEELPLAPRTARRRRGIIRSGAREERSGVETFYESPPESRPRISLPPIDSNP